VRLIPIGEYRYCWSRNTSDLLSILKGADVADVENLLDSAQYVENDLGGAHSAGHEVMLSCRSCVAIPIELLGLSPAAKSSKSLILP